MAKYDELAEKIIDKVGGKENIAGVTHCTTKLRFQLKDDSIARTKELKTMHGIVTVLADNTSYQVVIGYHAPEVYASVLRFSGIAAVKEASKKEKNRELLPADSIRGILLTALGVLAAVCLIKGLYALSTSMGYSAAGGSLGSFIQNMANTLLYALPVLLGYGMAVRLEMNRSMALAISLLVAVQGYWASLEAGGGDAHGMPEWWYVIPCTVLPLILILWAAYKINQWISQYITRTVRFAVIPFGAILINTAFLWWGVLPLYALGARYAGDSIMTGAAAAVGCVLLAVIAGKKKKPAVQGAMKTPEAALGSKKIKSPMTGRVIPLYEVKDEAFASGLLGDGRAIVPMEGRVYAPADGKVTGLFMDGHAISMLTEQGVQVLIHVGINTAELLGKGFNPKVVQNEIVNKGKLLLEFDLDGMKAAGYDVTSPIIITNFDEYTEMNGTDRERVKPGDDFLWML